MREPLHRPEVDESKSPHERFKELGERLMSVPKPELDEQEKEWQERNRRKRRRPKSE